MSKKKKIIVLSCMIVLLAVTAVFNFVLSAPSTSADDSVSAANYFVEYKTERSESRSEQLLQLDSVISASEENSDIKTEALALKIRLTEIIEKELLLEKLIKAKGYEDTVVSIGLTSENINVIVKDANFDQDDAVIIYTILAEEANATPEKVNIIPIGE
ncbi:MAG: SpoIIIAH-like family protein [Clostridia bacterium]|nr:SpoIIIAH-like family protein [Clostridia bacterium]